MKNRFLSDIGIKILALFFGVLIWIVIANVDDYMVTKRFNNIHVELINEEAITSQDKVYQITDGDTVDVVVKGRRKIVDYLKASDLKAIADMSKISVTNAIQIEIKAVDETINAELSITCIDNVMTVAIEDKEEKTMPVTVTTVGKPKNNYAVGPKTATPNMVDVTAASSLLSKIKEVRVEVDVEGANNNINVAVKPTYYDGNGEQIDSSLVECNVNSVDTVVEILHTKEVPVEIHTEGDVKEGYKLITVDYQPTTLTIAGTEEALEDVAFIAIDDVSLTGLDADTEVAVDLAGYLPDGIVVGEDLEQIMVKIDIEKISTKKFDVLDKDIEISHQDSKYTYTIDNADKLSVTVTGVNDDISKLTVAKLKPSINVMDMTPGKHLISLEVVTEEGVMVDSISTVEISIEEK